MSNKYCQALVELRNKPAHELKEVGDQWRTPDNIFWGINTLFGPFVLDLFTDGDNAKCAAYYTAEDNALAHDWSERLAELKGAAFGNHTTHPQGRDSHNLNKYIWRFIALSTAQPRVIHIEATSEQEARQQSPDGCVMVFAARIRQEVEHV